MKKILRRALCILAWPVLLVLDIGIAACGVSTFGMARESTRRDIADAMRAGDE